MVANEKRSVELIKYLEQLLEEAKRGEILSIYGVAIAGENTYKTFGTYCPDIHTAAGILMQAAIDKLTS